MIEFAEQLHRIIEKSIASCSVELKDTILHRPEQIRMALPYLMIKELELYHMYNFHRIQKPNLKSFYRGVEIMPGYENALVIYHIDWLRVNDPALVYKVKFSVEADLSKVTVFVD